MNININSVELSKYIICKMKEKFEEEITHLKLQKLLYYVQAWSLVLLEEPILNEDFEAWLHGPVIRRVWEEYRNISTKDFSLPACDCTIEMSDDCKELIEDVLNEYGDKSGYYLEILTHEEDPWKEVYVEGKNNIISRETMKKYYGSKIGA